MASALLFFFPIAWYYGELHTLTFYIHLIKDHVPSAEPLFAKGFLTVPVIFTIALIVMPVVLIFGYRNLEQQLRLTRIHMMFLLVFIALLFFYYTEAIATKVNASAEFSFGIFLPLIALIFNYLTQRGIIRDIRLIRSVDRIR